MWTYVVSPCRIETFRSESLEGRVKQVNECSSNLKKRVSRDRNKKAETTHDNTTTEVFCKIKYTMRYPRAQPPRPPRQHREESTKHRSNEDDEDRGDPQAEELVAASALATVELVVVGSAHITVCSCHVLSLALLSAES